MAGRSVVTRLMLDPSGYLGGLKTAAAATRDFGRQFDQAATTHAKGFDKLSTGALIMGGGILAGFGVAAKSAMDFDKQMSSVGAAAGKTGKDLDALRQAALKAGADTAFSASQAAKGEEELAKAGVSAKDILGGGLKGALDLAAAGQLEVGESAEIAATAMTQFHLEGSKVPHVADLLSAAANKAQGSVHDVGMALKQGGLVASQFGLSIEETTGTLAAFAKAGLIGSDAGTSLKTMLLALANPSKESAELMRQLNINAYDAQGRFVGLAGLAGQLRTAMSGLSQAERDQALAQIFGNDAVRAANVLYQNGANGIQEWTKKVDDAGNAGRTAAQKMDNLAGDLERLEGSIETALIKEGSGATGVLRTLAQAGDNAVNAFSGMPAPMQATVTVLGLTVGSALAAAGAYGVMAPKVREASAALVAMGPAGRVANTALIGSGKWAGRAMVAFAGLQVVNMIAANFAEAAPDVNRLTKELERFAATGKVAGEMSRVFNPDLSGLKDAVTWVRNLGGMKRAQDAMGWEPGFIASQSFSVTKHVESLKALDQAMAQLVTSGNPQAAAAAVRATGLSSREAADMLPAYSGALRDARDATSTAGSAMGTAAGQARVMASGLAEAVHAAGNLDKVLHGLNDANISAAEAGIAWRQSLSGLTAEIRHNKGSTDANTQSMLNRIKAGQEALSTQHAQTTATRGESVANAQAASSHAQMRRALINTAVAAGQNRAAVTALVDAYFKIPPSRATHVAAPGAVRAEGEVGRLNAEIRRVRDRLAKVNVIGPVAATSEVGRLRAELARLQNRQVFLTLTTTYAYRGARPSGLPLNPVGSNLDKSRWGNVYAFARGGIPAHTVDSPTVLYGERETGGEAFIPRKGDPNRSKRILDVAAGWLGMRVTPMATGGLVGAAQELLGHIRAGGGYSEDFTFRGSSANLGRYNERLMSMYRGNWANTAQVMRFLASVGGAAAMSRNLGGVLGNMVRWGEVTPYVWNKLMQAGWRGKPGDPEDRLYGSWAQLLRAGWEDLPGDGRKMLYPPGTSKGRFSAGVGSAASELMGHLTRGGSTYNDLTWAGASKNFRKYNDFLLASYRSRHGDLRNRGQLMRFLNSYAHPGSGASAAGGSAGGAAAVSSRDVATVPSGPSFGNAGSSIAFTFTGPVGSRIELENWVTGYINDLRRQGRV